MKEASPNVLVHVSSHCIPEAAKIHFDSSSQAENVLAQELSRCTNVRLWTTSTLSKQLIIKYHLHNGYSRH